VPGEIDLQYAVASAALSFCAFVPLVCQLLGLILGAVGLARIRRCRRDGIEVSGTRWAVVGIAGNGFLLGCWIAVFTAMLLLRVSFFHFAEALRTLTPPS